jgi:hypothetical protein
LRAISISVEDYRTNQGSNWKKPGLPVAAAVNSAKITSTAFAVVMIHIPETHDHAD